MWPQELPSDPYYCAGTLGPARSDDSDDGPVWPNKEIVDYRTLVACDSAWEAYHQPRVAESQSSDQMLPDDQMHILRMFVIYLLFELIFPYIMLPRQIWELLAVFQIKVSPSAHFTNCSSPSWTFSLNSLCITTIHCLSIQIPILSFFQQMLHLNLFSQTLLRQWDSANLSLCKDLCIQEVPTKLTNLKTLDLE